MGFRLKLFLGLLFLLSSLWASPQSADQKPAKIVGLKITVRDAFNGMSRERTQYFQGDRKRLDYQNTTGGPRRADGSVDMRYGPHIASITRCDLGKMYELNLDSGEYDAAPYPPQPFTKEQMAASGIKPQGELPAAPTLLVEVTTRDTGERKDMLGHAARHVITTRKETPLEGSHSQPKESVTDGWYSDLATEISCDWNRLERKRGYAHVAGRLVNANAPPELPKFVEVGERETGFPLESTTTMRWAYLLPDGTKKEATSTFETKVTVFAEGPLDPALFEIPKGFREVAHIDTSPKLDWQTAWNNAWVRFKARLERLFN